MVAGRGGLPLWWELRTRSALLSRRRRAWFWSITAATVTLTCRTVSMGRTLRRSTAARLLYLQAAAQAAHVPVAKTVVVPQRLNSSVGRSVGRPLEMHTASQMPIGWSLYHQAAVLVSSAACASYAKPEGLLLPLITLGFYIHHCATCYPAQLIRRRVFSMDSVDRIGSGVPSIRWRARAYHMETRWYRVTVTSKDGSTHQEWRSRQVQVTTHKIEVEVPALEWSYKERRSGFPSETPWTSVRAQFRAYPRNCESFNALKAEFQYFHDRDTYLDFTETVTLDGVQLNILEGGAIEGALGETQFFLLLSPEGARDAPTLTSWVLVCMLMISVPYQTWLGSSLEARGASAAVEYSRGFKLNVRAARRQLGLNRQGELLERERAMKATRQGRELSTLVEMGTAVMAYTSMLP